MPVTVEPTIRCGRTLRSVDDQLLLRPGLPAQSVLDALRDLISAAGNIAATSGLGRLITQHLAWVEGAEFQLRNSFVSAAVWQALFNDRYWQIRNLATGVNIRSEALRARRQRAAEAV